MFTEIASAGDSVLDAAQKAFKAERNEWIEREQQDNEEL
jgi:hypothetical protein